MATTAADRLLTEARAKFIDLGHSPQTAGQTIGRWWDKVEDKAMKLCLDKLDAAAFTVMSPKAGWETYPGTWRVVRNTMGKEYSKPGIVQVLAKVYDPTEGIVAPLTAADGLLAHPHVITSQKEVLELFSLKEGDGQKRVYIFRNLNPTTTIHNALMAHTAADLEAKFWGSLADRKWIEEENHTATFMLAFEDITWDGSWAADKQLQSETNKNGIISERGYGANGIPVDNLQTAVSGFTPESGYALGRVTARETGKGAGSLSSRQVKINSIAAAEVIRSNNPGLRSGIASRKLTWKNVSLADATLLVADAHTNKLDLSGCSYEPEASGFALDHTVAQEHSGDNLFDVTRYAYKIDATTFWIDQGPLLEYRLERMSDSTVTTAGYEKVRWRWWRYTYYISYLATEGEAWSEIDDGHQGSNVGHPHSLVWRAKKVTGTDVGAWNTGAITAPALSFP